MRCCNMDLYSCTRSALGEIQSSSLGRALLGWYSSSLLSPAILFIDRLGKLRQINHLYRLIPFLDRTKTSFAMCVLFDALSVPIMSLFMQGEVCYGRVSPLHCSSRKTSYYYYWSTLDYETLTLQGLIRAERLAVSLHCSMVSCWVCPFWPTSILELTVTICIGLCIFLRQRMALVTDLWRGYCLVKFSPLSIRSKGAGSQRRRTGSTTVSPQMAFTDPPLTDLM